MNDSGDEEEQDAIVSQVLDEIGIEITGKVEVFFHFKMQVSLLFTEIVLFSFWMLQEFIKVLWVKNLQRLKMMTLKNNLRG